MFVRYFKTRLACAINFEYGVFFSRGGGNVRMGTWSPILNEHYNRRETTELSKFLLFFFCILYLLILTMVSWFVYGFLSLLVR